MLRRKQRVLFAECAEQWMKQKRKIVKESTMTTYSRILGAQILPAFGKIPVGKITKEQIKEFMRQKEACGRTDGTGGLSNKSCKDMLVVLMAILEFAEDVYGIKNVIKETKTREFVAFAEKPMVETLSEEECRRLTRVLFQKGDGEAIGILLSLYTGLRLGEVCALRWENIDLERGVFKVRTTMARVLSTGYAEKSEKTGKATTAKTRLVFTAPKTSNSIRDVPIPEILLPLLCRKTSRSGFLLTGAEHYMDMRTLQNHFKRILKENEFKEVHFHCLRHTFATNCVNLDFDIKTISEILGHSSTTVTWERYVHSSMNRKQDLMRQLSEKLCV